MQEMHSSPSNKSTLDSFPFVLLFLNASLCEINLCMLQASFLVYVYFHKKCARRRLCIKDLLLPKGSSNLEDTPCKLYKLTCKHPCMTIFLLLYTRRLVCMQVKL